MNYRLFISAFFSFALLALWGCSSTASNPPLRMEQPIAAATRAPAAPAAWRPYPKLPPPTAAEVRERMQGIFGSDLLFTTENGHFIVGDFNGDGAEDLGVIARPAADKLSEVNSELANWIIEDADQAMPPARQSVVRLAPEAPPRVAANESVLVVIHGFGPRGWRNPEARQAYVVKHAAGTLEATAPSISQPAVRAMHLPVETEIIKSIRNNRKGFVFWTGGFYAWHPRES